MRLKIIFNKPMDINGMGNLVSYALESYPPYLDLKMGEREAEIKTSHIKKTYSIDDIKSIHITLEEE